MQLAEFPSPPAGKTGWPWTVASPPIPAALPDGSPWPRISIVTPSYNQAQFIEETIRSVLLQGYPNLEYILMDGGSTDGSVEIMRKYAPWLAYWVSEKDRGQAHAINQGFARSSGEIMAWINSDDYYAPGAFQAIAQTMAQEHHAWLAGRCQIVDPNGAVQAGWEQPVKELERWFVGSLVMQPGVFWSKALWEKTHHLDETLHFSLDYDLWFQFIQAQALPHPVDAQVAYFRTHAGSKTSLSQEKFHLENEIVQARYRHLLTHPGQKLKVQALRNSRRASELLAQKRPGEGISTIPTLLSALALAPWLLFRRSFYDRARRLICG